MDKQIGTVSILVKDRKCIKDVNNLLSEYHDMIMGRIGFPHHEKGIHVITVVVEGEGCDIMGLAEKLDKMDSVCTKAVLLCECNK